MGQDFLMASNPGGMHICLEAITQDADTRAALIASGLETIRARHTCAHRVDELEAILATLAPEKVPA